MKKLLLSIVLLTSSLLAQRSQLGNPPKPKPAFPGQTDAAAPAKPSPKLNIETITTRLNGPWSLAFLPDGNFLVTEGIGTMRIVRPDGVVSAPIAGVPPVKVVAAQGLHDVVLDPDFARNRPSTSLTSRRPRRRRRPLAHRILLSTGLDQIARRTPHHEPRNGARSPRPSE